MRETTTGRRLRLRGRSALALSIGAIAALTGAAYAVPGHQDSSVVSYTGCIAPTTGTLSRFAVGDAPKSECPDSSEEIHVSGGDITAVRTPAGSGLSGGAENGAITLRVDPTAFAPSDRIFSSGVVRVPADQTEIVTGPNDIRFLASCPDNPLIATLTIVFPTDFMFWRRSFLRGDFASTGSNGGVQIASAGSQQGGIDSGVFNSALIPEFGDHHVLNGNFLILAEVGSRRCKFQITAISD